jgi:hypothetical protein
MSEGIDHIDWECKQTHTTKKHDQNPSEERQDGHDVNGQ